MIIVSFGCGLGNQMFEYAFYLSLKYVYDNVVIKADTQYVLPNEHNGFELNYVFGIQMPESSLKEVMKYSDFIPRKKRFLLYRIIRFITKKLGFIKKSYYIQKDYTEYYSDVYDLDPCKNYYMQGIWGNYRYFNNMESFLQDKVFIFQYNRLNEKSRKYKETIENCRNPISIHVRKGDFIEYENTVLDHKYYDKAVQIMEGFVPDLTFFIFSDDYIYAKELFGNFVNAKFVEGNNGMDSWMDMYLMSLCRHNIIANSSFSFWGAYLNKNDKKIVIAPNIAFRQCRNPFVCGEWIVVDV